MQYFEPILQEHSEIFTDVYNKGVEELNQLLGPGNYEIADHLQILRGQEYPHAIDEWLELGRWGDISARHIMWGYIPPSPSGKYFLELSYFADKLNKQKGRQESFEMRLDGLSDILFRDLIFLMKRYEVCESLIAKIKAKMIQIWRDINDGLYSDSTSSTSSTRMFRKYETFHSRFENPNSPESYLGWLQGNKKYEPLWLEEVIKMNTGGNFKLESKQKTDFKNTRRLLVLKGWMIGKSIPFETMMSDLSDYNTHEKVWNELKKCGDNKLFRDYSFEERTALDFFVYARKMEYAISMLEHQREILQIIKPFQFFTISIDTRSF